MKRLRSKALTVSLAVCLVLASGVTAACGAVGSMVPFTPGGGSPLAAQAATPVRHDITQATSDRAQLNTIAFDGLGFLTGTLGSDSFFPPGKVADFWGFQYLRDNDPTEMGHNTDFLTKVALNTYNTLTPKQRTQLRTLAKKQVGSINTYGYRRFVLMDAFRRNLEGDLPAGTTGLNPDAVMDYSAGLYKLDGRISYQRAQVMGGIIRGLSKKQRAKLNSLKGKGVASWPNAIEPKDMRGLSRDEKVAVMTYAADLYAWYAGSVTADVYFCPERHGTYFGSFYLKDAKAVGSPGYSIPTTMTGDMGEAFLNALDPTQRATITQLVEQQRSDISGIVDARTRVSKLLRRFRSGKSVSSKTLANLMGDYGAHDGALSYRYAAAFAQVAKTLTPEQKATFASYRTQMVGNLSPTGAYLYSQPIAMPQIPSSDFLFK